MDFPKYVRSVDDGENISHVWYSKYGMNGKVVKAVDTVEPEWEDDDHFIIEDEWNIDHEVLYVPINSTKPATEEEYLNECSGYKPKVIKLPLNLDYNAIEFGNGNYVTDCPLFQRGRVRIDTDIGETIAAAATRQELVELITALQLALELGWAGE